MTKMEKLRRRIDKVDQKLMTLISERLRLMDFIRHKRKKQNKPVINKQKVKQILDSRLKLAKKLQLRATFVKKLIKIISKECQKRLKNKQ